MEIVAGFSILFMVGALLASVGVLAFATIAPLFMSGSAVQKPKVKYLRVVEREYDFDED